MLQSFVSEQALALNASQGINAKNINFIDLIEQPAWKTILIDLVESNKMDPWDVDVSQLTDKYLQKIHSLQGTNLRLPANAILVCALLLKFKAKYLRFTEFFKEEPKIDLFKQYPEFRDLREAMPVLKNPKRIKEGKVSIDSLVNVIEEMLSKSKEGKKTLERIKPKELVDFKVMITEINVEEKMNELLEKIKSLKDSQGIVLFNQLIQGKSVLEIVSLFLYTLYLANKQLISVWQEEFFESEIFIALKE